MRLNDKAKDLLRDIVGLNGWYVSAELIPPAGELISAGYVYAVDDYEGPQLYSTERGIKAAKRLKLVRHATADELREPYQNAFVRINLNRT